MSIFFLWPRMDTFEAIIWKQWATRKSLSNDTSPFLLLLTDIKLSVPKRSLWQNARACPSKGLKCWKSNFIVLGNRRANFLLKMNLWNVSLLSHRMILSSPRVKLQKFRVEGNSKTQYFFELPTNLRTASFSRTRNHHQNVECIPLKTKLFPFFSNHL